MTLCDGAPTLVGFYQTCCYSAASDLYECRDRRHPGDEKSIHAAWRNCFLGKPWRYAFRNFDTAPANGFDSKTRRLVHAQLRRVPVLAPTALISSSMTEISSSSNASSCIDDAVMPRSGVRP